MIYTSSLNRKFSDLSGRPRKTFLEHIYITPIVLYCTPMGGYINAGLECYRCYHASDPSLCRHHVTCASGQVYMCNAYFAIYDNLLKWTSSRYFQLSPNSYYLERTMNNSNVGSILLARLYLTYLIEL